jgi:hypothetical protein
LTTLLCSFQKDPKVKKLVAAEVEKIPKEKRTENNLTIAFVVATNKALKVSNGEEALEVWFASTAA